MKRACGTTRRHYFPALLMQVSTHLLNHLLWRLSPRRWRLIPRQSFLIHLDRKRTVITFLSHWWELSLPSFGVHNTTTVEGNIFCTTQFQFEYRRHPLLAPGPRLFLFLTGCSMDSYSGTIETPFFYFTSGFKHIILFFFQSRNLHTLNFEVAALSLSHPLYSRVTCGRWLIVHLDSTHWVHALY